MSTERATESRSRAHKSLPFLLINPPISSCDTALNRLKRAGSLRSRESSSSRPANTALRLPPKKATSTQSSLGTASIGSLEAKLEKIMCRSASRLVARRASAFA